MVDVATLAILTQTSDLDKATASLQKLRAEAGPTEQATTRLGQRFSATGQEAGAAATKTNQFVSSVADGVPGLRNFSAQAQLSGLAIAGLAGAVSVAGAAIIAATKIYFDAVQAVKAYEVQHATVEAVLRATGTASGQTAAQIEQLSFAIARGTLATSAGVNQAATTFLTFQSIAGETFERTLRASQDLAAVGFGSLQSSALQLGRALEDPAAGLAALRRVGITFTSAQRELIRTLDESGRKFEAQQIILAAVEEKVGGAGAAQASGLAGATNRLAENWNRLIETVGNTGPWQAAVNAISGVIESITGRLDPSLQQARARLAELQQAQTEIPGGSAATNLIVQIREQQQLVNQLVAETRAREESARFAADAGARAQAEATAERTLEQTKKARTEADKQAAAEADRALQRRLANIDRLTAAERESLVTDLTAEARSREIQAQLATTATERAQAEAIAERTLAAARQARVAVDQAATTESARLASASSEVITALQAEVSQLERLAAAQGQGPGAVRAVETQINAENEARQLGISLSSVEGQRLVEEIERRDALTLAIERSTQARLAAAGQIKGNEQFGPPVSPDFVAPGRFQPGEQSVTAISGQRPTFVTDELTGKQIEVLGNQNNINEATRQWEQISTAATSSISAGLTNIIFQGGTINDMFRSLGQTLFNIGLNQALGALVGGTGGAQQVGVNPVTGLPQLVTAIAGAGRPSQFGAEFVVPGGGVDNKTLVATVSGGEKVKISQAGRSGGEGRGGVNISIGAVDLRGADASAVARINQLEQNLQGMVQEAMVVSLDTSPSIAAHFRAG